MTSSPRSKEPRDERSASDDELASTWEELSRGVGEKAKKQIDAELAAAEARAQRKPTPRTTERTTPIAVRFDEFTIKRLRALAQRRNIGYQTLLKQFVVERIYEEERREGIIE